MSGGPLDDDRLRAVEGCLDAGRFEEAQQRLAALGPSGAFGPALTYLTTRLLFLRGRLDRAAVRERIEDVLAQCPDFPEARALLRVTSPPPPPRPATEPAPPPSRPNEPPSAPPPSSARTFPQFVLKTPSVPPPARLGPPFAPLNLGRLEPPRSEVPTEPAPAPVESVPPSPKIALRSPRPAGTTTWDPLELELANGNLEAALATLERLAADRLDTLLVHDMPEAPRLATEAAAFLTRAPAAWHFAPYDLSLKSLERLDAVLALVASPELRTPPYALAMLLACYAGECVRLARGGTWQGRVAEPTTLIVSYGNEGYEPLDHVEQALRAGRSLRLDAGPSPHPAAEPPEAPHLRPIDPPTPWDPATWPELSRLGELGRTLRSSAIGLWAERSVHLPLDRSLESLEAIERFLALVAPGVAVPGAPSTEVAERRAAVLAGAYVGEILCFHGAGRWNDNDVAPEGPLRFEVLMPDGEASYPVLLARDTIKGARERLTDRVRGALGT